MQAAFKGKNALITGAAKRIGRAVALALAEAGSNIVVHYHTSKTDAEGLSRELEKKGAKVWLVPADIGDPKEAESLIDRALSACGSLDFVINNASIFPESRLLEFSVEEFYRNMNVNALAPFLIGRSYAKSGAGGAIINFLDTRINRQDEKHAAYHASKRMLHTLTKLMALDFAPAIRVNGICPGLILPPEGQDASYLERLAHTNVLNRVGSLHDITQSVLFLLASPFITGEILNVDGGAHLKGSLYGHQ